MVIACGTARGHIVRWRCLVEDAGHATDADWEPLPLIEVSLLTAAQWRTQSHRSLEGIRLSVYPVVIKRRILPLP